MKPHYIITRDGRFVRPFRFEDLDGRPEPESWGPRYSKPVKKRKLDVAPMKSNSASGQPFEFSAKLHRATMQREFQAAVERDRKRRPDAEIIAAYHAAMAEKAIGAELAQLLAECRA